jgi:hypothetical protein
VLLPLFDTELARALSLHSWQRRGVWIVEALRMAETAWACANTAWPGGRPTPGPIPIRYDIKNDIVRTGRVAANAFDLVCRQKVQFQSVTNLPGNHVIGAGGVAADAEAAHFAGFIV